MIETQLPFQYDSVNPISISDKGVVREMLNTQGRAENSVIVWREAEEGRWSITSYLRKTKSKVEFCTLDQNVSISKG